MPSKQEIVNLEAEIKKQKDIAKELLAKQLDAVTDPNHVEIAGIVDAIVEAAFLSTAAHYLSWYEDIPGEQPRQMRRIPYSTEFVPVESPPTEDMSALGFAIDIDEAITLKIRGANTYADGDCSVEITAGDVEASVSLRTLSAALNELTRLAKTYYPPEEDDTTIQA